MKEPHPLREQGVRAGVLTHESTDRGRMAELNEVCITAVQQA